MRKIAFYLIAAFAAAAALYGCECLDDRPGEHHETETPYVALGDVARLLSEISIGTEQLREVSDAVSSSSENGYDEEYTMRDLFRTPGAGVGEDMLPAGSKSSVRKYERPLRDIIREHLMAAGKSSGQLTGNPGTGADEFLSLLESSDIQIYWPFSDRWDGKTLPVITFDPADGSDVNVGYAVREDSLGNRTVEEVIVDEEMASVRPVWVVNRNDDAAYTSLEILRRLDPEWGNGGGSIVVRPTEGPVRQNVSGKGKEGRLRTLVLKDFTMLRNYDPWFAGASEFFVKMGSVEDFTASTEAELKLYSPSITDFMITVKRKHVGEPRPFNAVLVSDWTDQLDQCALMITEDDGGTRTSWKCTAVVKIASKSYGVEINLPFNTRDDIVWRGQLSRRYIEENSDVTGHFGDVDLTFQILE